MLGARLSRRAVLLGTFVIVADLLLARDSLPRSRVAAVDPAEAIRDRAVAASRHLVALYAATVARHPQLRARLAPLAAEHQAHLEALTGEPATQQLPLPTHEAQATLTPAPGEPTRPPLRKPPCPARRRRRWPPWRAPSGRRPTAGCGTCPPPRRSWPACSPRSQPARWCTPSCWTVMTHPERHDEHA